MFPYNMIRLMQRVTLALLLSLACGLVFYQIRDGHEQEHLWDRVALYHVLLFLFPLPILLLEMHNGNQLKSKFITLFRFAPFKKRFC